MRKVWIDTLRAFAIFFVVFGHQAYWCDNFFVITTPIKMPLFFAITGYLFKSEAISFLAKLKHLLYRVGIPWFALGLSPIIVACVWKGNFLRIGNYILDMISGKVLWFMPCFIISEIIFFLNLRLSKRKECLIAGICVSECIIGYILGVHHIADYAMINRALIAQLFMGVGYFFKQYEKNLIKVPFILLLLLFFVGLSLSFLEYNLIGFLVDVHMNQYPCFLVDMIVIVIECYFMFYLFCRINLGNKISAYVGRNTLLIFILAPYFSTAIYKLLILLHISITNSYILALAVTIFIIMIGSLLSEICAFYVPWVIGLKKKNYK